MIIREDSDSDKVKVSILSPRNLRRRDNMSHQTYQRILHKLDTVLAIHIGNTADSEGTLILDPLSFLLP